MNLLGTALYDPAAAVSKATSSLLAMTAIDTTNLRLTVTVPSHGKLRFHMRGLVTGATTVPTLLIGVMNGATVVGRVTPTYENATASATTQAFVYDADFTVTGLTPGSTAFDAAYAVQVIVASTNIKYGGPNNASGANAWGGYLFEIWDPQPMQTNAQLVIDANGGVDIRTWRGGAIPAPNVTGVPVVDDKYLLGTIYSTPATAGIQDINVKNMNNVAATPITTIKAVQGLATDGVVPTVTTVTNQLTAAQIATGVWQDTTAGDFTVASSIGKSIMNGVALGTGLTVNIVTTLTNLPAITANWLTAAGIAASALNGKGDWNIGKTGYALSAAAVQSIWDALTSALTTVGSIGKLFVDNLNATISSRMATYTQPTGFLAATFPGTVASTTNITAATGVTVSTNSDKTGYSLSSAGIQAIWDALTSALTTVGSIGKYISTSLSTYAGGAVASVTGAVGSVTGNVSGNVVGSVGSVTGLTAANLDVAVSTRSTYAGADTAGTTTLLSRLTAARAGYLDTLNGIVAAIWAAVVDSSGVTTLLARLTGTRATNLDNLDAATSSRLATTGYTAPDNTSVAAIKGKTDSLTFTKAGEVDANIQSVNDAAVKGNGQTGSEWGPV